MYQKQFDVSKNAIKINFIFNKLQCLGPFITFLTYYFKSYF